MPLPDGTRLGPYEILGAIGAGGMGEVYRARDTQLRRDVAIKVLPEAFAQDADRLARLTREGQTLAALNHPNIAHVYGLDRQEGREGRALTFIAMELVEGEDLAQELEGLRAKGSGLPIDEALAIARQIADALEAAHEKGVIHRDLKPANIMVTGDGQVKVLDFGLAKHEAEGAGRAGAAAPEVAQGFSPAVSESPTLTTPALMTGVGVILGTAAYMSPEQAKGRAADKRSDVWAFGCVLFEMLTSKRAFEGADVSDTLAAILRGEPDWRALPADLPAAIQTLLRRCLRKDRKDRLADIADARLEIADALTAPSGDANVMTAAPRRAVWRSPVFVAVASAVVTGAIVGLAAWTVPRNSRDRSATAVVRFAIHDTDKVIVSRANGDLALSPDGRTLAFVGLGEGGLRVWVRPLDALDPRPLPGTEGAAGPCWSPDGLSIAFSAEGRIKRVAVSGGRPQVLSETSLSINRAFVGSQSSTWGSEGTILFAGSDGAVWRVGADGGVPAMVAGREERYSSPAFLPDGRHFLVAVEGSDPAKAGTFVAALDGRTRSRLLAFPAPARYVSGRLLFVRDRTLYAQPFDVSRAQLTGDPVQLAGDVSSTFDASTNGVTAYAPVSASGQASATELLWKDRRGEVLGRIDHAAGATRPALSPDSRRVAMVLRGDVWLFELARGVLSRVTSGRKGNNPIWSPDGQVLFLTRPAFRNGKDIIVEIPLGGAGNERTLREPTGSHAHPTSVSADGQYLVYDGEDAATDIWALRLTGDRKASPYVQTSNVETQGTLSPDGHWLAYTSDLSGRFEVYVQSFPEPGSRIQVSADGGNSARWRRDGKELFYLAPDGALLAVPVRSAPPIEFGAPATLFQFFSSERGIPANTYDVTPDGQRFIVSAVVRQPDPSLYVLLNWPSLVAGSKP